MSTQLNRLQQTVYAAITRSEAAPALPLVRPSSTLTSAQRLAIYQRSYVARLLECLSSIFPALQHALGDDLFRRFALDYLRHHPPAGYTLANLADRFPHYLEETRPPGEQWPDFLISLATLELAVLQVADGPGLEGQPLTGVEAPAALPDEALLALRPSPAPCWRLFAFPYPVHPYRLAVRRGRRPDLPSPQRCFVAVTRHRYRVTTFEMDEDEYRLLRLFDGRRSVSEALAAIHPGLSAQQLAQDPPARQYRKELANLPAGEVPLCGRVPQKLAQDPPARQYRKELANLPAGEVPLCGRVPQKIRECLRAAYRRLYFSPPPISG
ncbi:MAG: putative DNA-binding domain-containing protein [Bryobacterales bacterium]|nr:putative DNA-binding domain-containing protein [Bryobacterales bacterium]